MIAIMMGKSDWKSKQGMVPLCAGASELERLPVLPAGPRPSEQGLPGSTSKT